MVDDITLIGEYWISSNGVIHKPFNSHQKLTRNYIKVTGALITGKNYICKVCYV